MYILLQFFCCNSFAATLYAIRHKCSYNLHKKYTCVRTYICELKYNENKWQIISEHKKLSNQPAEAQKPTGKIGKIKAPKTKGLKEKGRELCHDDLATIAAKTMSAKLVKNKFSLKPP